VFFYLFKLLFSGFLQFKGNFARGQNNSKIPALSSFKPMRSRKRNIETPLEANMVENIDNMESKATPSHVLKH